MRTSAARASAQPGRQPARPPRQVEKCSSGCGGGAPAMQPVFAARQRMMACVKAARCRRRRLGVGGGGARAAGAGAAAGVACSSACAASARQRGSAGRGRRAPRRLGGLAPKTSAAPMPPFVARRALRRRTVHRLPKPQLHAGWTDSPQVCRCNACSAAAPPPCRHRPSRRPAHREHMHERGERRRQSHEMVRTGGEREGGGRAAGCPHSMDSQHLCPVL